MNIEYQEYQVDKLFCPFVQIYLCMGFLKCCVLQVLFLFTVGEIFRDFLIKINML